MLGRNAGVFRQDAHIWKCKEKSGGGCWEAGGRWPDETEGEKDGAAGGGPEVGGGGFAGHEEAFGLRWWGNVAAALA